MTDKEIFLYIKQKKDWKTRGDDVQYKVEASDADKRVYLFFQESASKQDWKVNFDFPAKLYKEQEAKFYVHRGYGESWKTCNDAVMEDFITVLNHYKDYTPVICGWSYGGAMAVLAAEDFSYRTKLHNVQVITFGAPRILYLKKSWKHFLQACGQVRQYAQVNDFVTWCIPLPFVYHLNAVKCGAKFSFKKIFNTAYNHCHYDEVISN